MASIDEQTGGRLELTGARVRALFGGGARGRLGAALENAGDPARPPDDADVDLLSDRIAQQSTTLSADAARAIASDIVARARAAVDKLDASTGDAALTDDDVISLESVLQVRGRPAVRVLGSRLESLDRYPGSDLWQIFITDYEDAMVAAAGATGAVMVTSAETVNRPWLQGSAWLVAPDRVVTNRHVVIPPPPNGGVVLAARDASGALQLRQGVSVDVKFDADDRGPAPAIQRKVTGVLFVSPASDLVDIAVLSIEPIAEYAPLRLQVEETATPSNLFVIGHPGLMAGVPSEVQAVFGQPDGRKRVSFGKRLAAGGRISVFGHDASTVGGFSGGPVVGIKGDAVAGLHYYGDPVNGNLAVTADAIREHASFEHFGGGQ